MKLQLPKGDRLKISIRLSQRRPHVFATMILKRKTKTQTALLNSGEH